MKKILIAFLLLCCAITLPAQTLRQSVENGVQTSVRQSENHEWREAFATCRSLDAMIGKGNPDLHYLVAKERFRLYYHINKMTECRAQLALMENYARASRKNDLIEDMLTRKAGLAKSTGKVALATECYKEILAMKTKGKDDDGKEQCFKDMIAKAKQEKNAFMADVIGRMYSQWTDSIAGIRSAKELKDAKAQYAAAQEEIDSKATKITAQWVFIVILIVIAAGLGAALAFFVLLMFKNVREIKHLKESLSLANSNNEQKNRFLNNISAQIRPSLNAMENGDTKRQIKALQSYMDHIEGYMTLEQTRDEHYEMAGENMAQFCQTMADEVKKMVRQGTAVTFNSQSITFSTNAEALRGIVRGIVGEAVKHDGVERITIEFKKRNPHTGHLNITVVGMKLPEEKRETLFQAFTETVNLTEDDGLTYPTCSLMAYKLDGHLRLDDEYRQGTRFVLELKG